MKNCIKCGKGVIKITSILDPEELRPQYFCDECNTLFSICESNNSIAIEPCYTEKVIEENRDLKTTIKTMLESKEDSH